MMDRRTFFGVAAGAGGALASKGAAAQGGKKLLKFLCPPDGLPDPIGVKPSPYAEPFVAELFVPPVKIPVTSLDPTPDPRAHQLYDQYPPQKLYDIRAQEFKWQYHPRGPYAGGTLGWGFDQMTPGPTFHARYGEPVLMRMINDIPPVGASQVHFALPSIATHLHNFHSASESDGNPQDWIDSGEFWDHHYASFPSEHNPLEKLSTLWYHDHRLDFTAANVYAGLSGFYLMFDPLVEGKEGENQYGKAQDIGDENADPVKYPNNWRLPSGDYDVPLIFHDVLFDPNGQVVFNNFFTDGWLGDQVTINRRIRPKFTVERRKYRFRILNGGPSRFYQLGLSRNPNEVEGRDSHGIPFYVITGDGNFQPEPVTSDSIFLSVAQRVDVIVDFSALKPGESVYMLNFLEQTNGKGPSGRVLDPPDGVMRFDVVERREAKDPSRIPDFFRHLPSVPPPADLRTLVHRHWEFDYDGGLWTINGRVMDPNRIDAGIAKNSEEVWTFRNNGNDWSHPVHCHFTEFLVLEINGRRPFDDYYYGKGRDSEHGKFMVQSRMEGDNVFVGAADSKIKHESVFLGGPRRDVATILPGDEMKVFFRFKDFEGRHVMHCHNVVHEDHAMMIRWDMLPEGEDAFVEARSAAEVWGSGFWGQAPNPKFVVDGPQTETKYESATPIENRNDGAFQTEVTRGSESFPPDAPKPADDGDGSDDGRRR